jgi:hypothetical protein
MLILVLVYMYCMSGVCWTYDVNIGSGLHVPYVRCMLDR